MKILIADDERAIRRALREIFEFEGYVVHEAENGEVKGYGKTSDEALAELKKAKDKLNLGLISQDEYDKVKAELVPFIK